MKVRGLTGYVKSLSEYAGVLNSFILNYLRSHVDRGGRIDRGLLNRVKLEFCRKLSLDRIPSNTELIKLLGRNDELRYTLTLKRRRSSSGVIVVAVMAKPHPCPHGRCLYCPSISGVPQSYTGHEPSSMRGLQHGFDPFLQVKSRLRQLKEMGHEVDKIELIVQGGTFPSTPLRYQRWFIKRCLDAITGVESSSLEEAKRNAEHAPYRNSGITVETRPDWCKERHVDLMLQLGVTRVELGVQTLDDTIYELVRRGHTVSDVVEAIRIAKDSGLKVCVHMMPGLPGSNPEKDLKDFEELFKDARFKPDMLKIYPCLVLKDSELYDWWISGRYKPYELETVVDLLAKVKEMVPPWIRIMRIQRDIPAGMIVAGVKKSNLRQLIHERLIEAGGRCRCIRCREAGLKADEPDPSELNIEIRKMVYEASEGLEIFISAEDFEEEVLVGYLRLRIPSPKAHRLEVLDSAIVRELHIYGRMLPVGWRKPQAFQHRGWGRRLLEEAECETVKYGLGRILVRSGLGVKPYYARLGYTHYGPYMAKTL
ncbi:MAG: tRNA uridine(34) 5-carboxymethylaminomethyl modification radical SAM/GNAT enzyme Elp3 [Candidatus Bathyarchaeia archaeon]